MWDAKCCCGSGKAFQRPLQLESGDASGGQKSNMAGDLFVAKYDDSGGRRQTEREGSEPVAPQNVLFASNNTVLPTLATLHGWLGLLAGLAGLAGWLGCRVGWLAGWLGCRVGWVGWVVGLSGWQGKKEI